MTKQTTAPRQKGRRERHIELLISDRRHLRKRWRKAAPDEKEGLKLLWDELKQKLAKLRRAERIRRRRKRKEKERKNFFKDPFRYARQLLDEKRSGKLAITKEDLEHYIKGQYTDAARDSPLGSPGYVPRPDPQGPLLTPPHPGWVRLERSLKRPDQPQHQVQMGSHTRYTRTVHKCQRSCGSSCRLCGRTNQFQRNGKRQSESLFLRSGIP